MDFLEWRVWFDPPASCRPQWLGPHQPEIPWLLSASQNWSLPSCGNQFCLWAQKCLKSFRCRYNLWHWNQGKCWLFYMTYSRDRQKPSLPLRLCLHLGKSGDSNYCPNSEFFWVHVLISLCWQTSKTIKVDLSCPRHTNCSTGVRRGAHCKWIIWGRLALIKEFLQR